MADKRNGRTEYNWSYSGDDAGNYRAKYTKGFDPAYSRRAAEETEEQEKIAQSRREQARRQPRQHSSVRRARLLEEQEIRTERHAVRGSVNREDRKRTPGRSRRERSSGNTRKRAGSRSRRQLVRRRYLFLGIAAAAGIFFLLLLLNSYTLTITLAGDDPLYVELGQAYQDPGATAVYRGSILHFRDREVPVVASHEINERACGTYEVTYRAEYGDLETTAKRMVIIPDREAPVITLDESVNVVKKGDEWKDSFTAIDDQDGDITANVEILGEVNMRRDGKYDLTYRVQDKAGNEATATRTVIVSSVAINRPETARQGDKNVIYLSFDDGPGMYTERLLDILDNHNVKATFFVTNANPASQDLIGEEYRRGHTIGVHSLTHDFEVIYENAAAFWEDIDQEMEIIKEQTGDETVFMRFPGGSSNDYIAYDDEMKHLLAAGLQQRGLKYYDWTIDSDDSNDENLTDDVYWNLVDQTSVADPKMVLCHDLKRTTVDAMDNFLSWAIENHYVFLPITEETPVVHHVEID